MFLFACGEQQAPPEAEQPQATGVAVPEEPTEPAEPEFAFSEEFIDHMHANADQMDEMMFALADGDLDAATTTAHLLSRQENIGDVPEEWQQYIAGIREDALAVENATDLETARAAAESISQHCQGCHDAAGVLTE